MSETLTARAEEAVRSPADMYDEQFVPALFRHWGPVLCDAANIAPGQRVLDVACGTGALTVAVAGRVRRAARCSGSMPIPRCWRWRGASLRTSNGTTAAPSRCRSPTRASTRWSASSA